MGCYGMSSAELSGDQGPEKLGKCRSRIERMTNYPSGCAVFVKYPDCKNYEGNKILVFRCSGEEILSKDFLEPHFVQGPHELPLLARFQPTDGGWKLANQLLESLPPLETE